MNLERGTVGYTPTVLMEFRFTGVTWGAEGGVPRVGRPCACPGRPSPEAAPRVGRPCGCPGRPSPEAALRWPAGPETQEGEETPSRPARHTDRSPRRGTERRAERDVTCCRGRGGGGGGGVTGHCVRWLPTQPGPGDCSGGWWRTGRDSDVVTDTRHRDTVVRDLTSHNGRRTLD